jgi:YihY family inner membrane protein
MNKLQKFANRFNVFQQRRRLLGFVVAVIKKYNEDEAGYKAALLTYYGFLSLFPLLLLLTTVTNNLVGSHSSLGRTMIKGITSYFPLLGNQLSSHVQGLHTSGLALVAGILFTLYGTRGVADVFRHGVQNLWLVPKSQQIGFPKSVLKSLGLIIIGGSGFLAASILSGFAASAGHGLEFRILSLAINLFILFWLFLFLLNFSLPRHVTARETLPGAATAAIGLVGLQLLGTYVLARELKSLDALYSYFAIALGLLFWIYLQAQLLYYAIEISVVSSKRLYPRSLSAEHATTADDHLAALRSKH